MTDVPEIGLMSETTPSRLELARQLRSPRIVAAHFARSEALGGYMALAGSGFETHLPPHVHAGYVLGVVDAGAVRVTVNGTSFVATAGMVVALPPFVVHTEFPVAEGGWSFRYLYPTEAVVREVLGLSSGSGAALRFARPVIDDVTVARAVARVHDGLMHGENADAGTDALGALVRQLKEHHCVTGGASSRLPRERKNISAVRDLLTERPRQNVKLSDLASEAGLSAFHFTRVFKAAIGLPPYAYYEQVRIAFAHLLIHEGFDLTSVAYQLGFADQSHLTRHFHRGSFTTPGHLAQLARAGVSSRIG